MDSNRSSRRSRHSATTWRLNGEQHSADDNGAGNEAPNRRDQQHQSHTQGLTPTNIIAAHRTPEQEVSGATTNNSSGRMPPINPFRLHRAMPHARVSMPEISDDSDSEPDTSALGMARERVRAREAVAQQAGFFPRLGIPAGIAAAAAQHGRQNTSMNDEDEDEDEDDLDTVDEDEEEHEDEQEAEEAAPLINPTAMGLKEISNLGRFTVSSHKQGNGVEELRSDDLNLYWQSDGPQPHNLTIYFVKRVEIRDLRFYVNYADDESYTPTKIIFKSGTSENSLIEFAQMTLDQPLGWQQVNITGAGGGPDGNTLVSYVLQMQILENHQNGKDTHLRGIKIYAFDADSGQGPGRENNPVEDMVEFIDGSAAARAEPGDVKERLSGLARRLAETSMDSGEAGFSIPEFMRDPEIR